MHLPTAINEDLRQLTHLGDVKRRRNFPAGWQDEANLLPRVILQDTFQFMKLHT